MPDIPPFAPVAADDVFALYDLVGRYGHAIDERQFDVLADVFTPTCTYDASDFGSPVLHSAAEVVEMMRSSDAHPLAHHATNIVLSPEPDGTVRIVSKGIGVGRRGRVGTVVYEDVARRTDA